MSFLALFCCKKKTYLIWYHTCWTSRFYSSLSRSLLIFVHKSGILNTSWVLRRWNEELVLWLKAQFRIGKIRMLQEGNKYLHSYSCQRFVAVNQLNPRAMRTRFVYVAINPWQLYYKCITYISLTAVQQCKYLVHTATYLIGPQHTLGCRKPGLQFYYFVKHTVHNSTVDGL